MNPWEYNASYDAQAANPDDQSDTVVQPAIFHSRLYTGSGIDAVSIMLELYNRPQPHKIEPGPIDASCPVIICDLKQRDAPIIYASDAFAALTGYSVSEVIGHNCRFLQTPPSGRVSSRRATNDKDAIKTIRRAVNTNRECQVTITNYRKDGRRFFNFLTIIPVRWQSKDFNYSIGLQVEVPDSA